MDLLLSTEFLEKAFMYVSAIVTIATAILTIWPSEKAEGVLAVVRKVLGLLSGNLGHNK